MPAATPEAIATSTNISTVTTAAAAMPITPRSLVSLPFSCRIRTITGSAVIEMNAAMNSAKPVLETVSTSNTNVSLNRIGLIAKAMRIGTTTTPTPTDRIELTLPFSCLRSSSRPTRNMNSSREICPMALRTGRACGGKMQLESAALTSGQCSHSGGFSPILIRPSSDGPSATPAMISPTTPGWPTRFAAAPKKRAATRMTATSNRTNAMTWPPESIPSLLKNPKRCAVRRGGNLPKGLGSAYGEVLTVAAGAPSAPRTPHR